MKRRYFTPFVGLIWWVYESNYPKNIESFVAWFLVICLGSIIAPSVALGFLLRLIDKL